MWRRRDERNETESLTDQKLRKNGEVVIETFHGSDHKAASGKIEIRTDGNIVREMIGER